MIVVLVGMGKSIVSSCMFSDGKLGSLSIPETVGLEVLWLER